MVLVKIIGQIQEGIHRKEFSGSNVDALRQEDSGDDSDEFELANIGCELVLVEGQTCTIPYELYDLTDLKEILSLETWNSCLTEEERFSLSALLPGMDQQTFWLTMKELLGGKDMFFGSPLAVLFERMKGGFYPPNVTCFREGLQFLQKRTFYHSLRIYHENMSQTLSNMKRAWSKCRPSIGVEERVRIWNNWKDHRDMKDVDLNAFPEDEDLLEKSNARTITDSVSKMVKFPPVVALAPLKTNGKGVLKIKPKPAAMHSIQTRMVCRPTPKGVLKVVPRGSLSQMHEPRAMPGRQEPSPLGDCLGFQTCRLSPSPQSTCRWDAVTHCEESSFLHQSVRGVKTYKCLEPPNCIISRQRVEHLNSTIGASGNFLSSIRKIKRAKHPSFDDLTGVQEGNLFMKNSLSAKKYSRRSSQTGEHLKGELWQNMGQKNIVCYNDSVAQQMAPRHDNQNMLYARTSDTVLRITGVGTGQRQKLAKSWDRSKRVQRDVDGGGLQKLYDESAVSKDLQDGATLPITYKRRKAFSKVNTLDIVNPRTAGLNLESRTL